jgi:uncharacterized membrane protein
MIIAVEPDQDLAMATIAPEILPPADEPRATRTSHRLAAIDIVRGVVMILMAIDHVRVYSGVPAGGPTAGVFFTRWVTHFVAPAFVFLAGTGAFLHGRRMGERSELARFLLTRGAWLVLLELTFVRVMWTFNVDFGSYLLAGVIWVIGICMMLMAALIYLPSAAIGALGVAIIVGHNLMNFLPPAALTSLRGVGYRRQARRTREIQQVPPPAHELPFAASFLLNPSGHS